MDQGQQSDRLEVRLTISQTAVTGNDHHRNGRSTHAAPLIVSMHTKLLKEAKLIIDHCQARHTWNPEALRH
jgi:hypothetical protein